MHNVLLICGGHIPHHDYPATQRLLADVLEHDGLGVRTAVAPPAELDLMDVHAVVAFTDGDFFTPDAITRLAAYVRRGHGLVTLHTAVGSNPGSDVWGTLVGSRIEGGTIVKHTAHVTAETHPITAGVKDFELDDEVHVLRPTASFRTLVDADLNGTRQPLVYVKDEGDGRTVHFATGHSVAGVSTAAWQTLFRRGVRWAAGALT